MVDEPGVPLSIIVTGANCHDVSQLVAVLDARLISADSTDEEVQPNLCTDAGHAGKSSADEIMRAHGNIPHVRFRGEEASEKVHSPEYRAERRVVEASHSCFDQFRKLTVRYEKSLAGFLALDQLAAAIIALRKVIALFMDRFFMPRKANQR